MGTELNGHRAARSVNVPMNQLRTLPWNAQRLLATEMSCLMSCVQLSAAPHSAGGINAQHSTTLPPPVAQATASAQ